jgi:hypothetical protein
MGPRVAWLSGTGKNDTCDKVILENLSTRARTTITQSEEGASELVSCARVDSAVQLALAGTRALWSSVNQGNSQDLTLWSGGSTQLAGRAILASTYHNGGGGMQYRGIAGNGKTLVYALINWTRTSDCPEYEQTQVCNDVRGPSPIRRVDQQGGVRNVSPSNVRDGIAASGEFVASIRGPQIVVLRTSTGAQVGSAVIGARCCNNALETPLRGIPVALGSKLVAVAVGSTIEVYDWRTHAHVRRVQLSERASGFALSGTLLVWATGQYDCRAFAELLGCYKPTPCNRACSISVLDLSTGSRRVVAHPTFDPFDLSIVGRRIVWGENEYAGKSSFELRPVHGYIRMLRIP